MKYVDPIVQTTIQPIVHIGHPENMDEVDKLVTDSPSFTLASVSSKLLKYAARETIPTPAQGMSLERQIPSIDLETPSRELSLPPESKQPIEPSAPHQQTIDQLTQELA